MLTLQQDVVRRMKVTGRAAGVPTAHWSANYTPHTVVPPCRAFYDRLACTVCLCPVALSCRHCDVVNPTLQIGRRSAVALSSPMCQITTDAPVSDVRHHYRSDTINYSVVPAVTLPPPHQPTDRRLLNALPTRLAGGMASGSVELSVIPRNVP